jgi:metal-dependent HD superfamily phosphatase/phosphodiesterase
MDGVQIEGFEWQEYNAVILVALLHDIGKLLHRKNQQTYKVSHQETGTSLEDREGRVFPGFCKEEGMTG